MNASENSEQRRESAEMDNLDEASATGDVTHGSVGLKLSLFAPSFIRFSGVEVEIMMFNDSEFIMQCANYFFLNRKQRMTASVQGNK